MSELLTDAWTQLRPHPGQSALWRDPHRFKLVVAGRGSGKTEIARRRTVRYLPVAKSWDDPMYFYALPTYGQAKRVAWAKILKLVPPNWIVKRLDGDMMIRTVWGSELWVVGMDKPQRIEGSQWDGGVIDESSDIRPGAFALSVLPALSHKQGWCWRIGVPKRFGVGGAEFRRDWEKARDGLMPQTKSYWWRSSDILSPEELALARTKLDPKGFAEQYDASWETAGGGVFYCFSRDGNVLPADDPRVMYNKKKPIVVGCDFNVDPMAWTFSHQYADHYCTFDELWIRDTNTRAALDWVVKRYGDHEAGFLFIGDATSSARQTSASLSDYQQIQNDERLKRKRVWFPPSNPPRRDRFAACNTLLLTAAGGRQALISKKCVHIIEDLENRSYIEGTTEVNDSGDLGHVSDAWGYPIHRLYPLSGTTKSKVTAI